MKINRIFNLILKYKLLLFLFQKYKMSKFSPIVIILNIKDVNFTANIKVYIYSKEKKKIFILWTEVKEKSFSPLTFAVNVTAFPFDRFSRAKATALWWWRVVAHTKPVLLSMATTSCTFGPSRPRTPFAIYDQNLEKKKKREN